jgi:hypothetical protein
LIAPCAVIESIPLGDSAAALGPLFIAAPRFGTMRTFGGSAIVRHQMACDGCSLCSNDFLSEDHLMATRDTGMQIRVLEKRDND